MSEENKKLLHRIAQLEDDLEEEQNESLKHLEKSKKQQQSVSFERFFLLNNLQFLKKGKILYYV